MPDYMLDIGDSNNGQIGLCGYTKADSPAEALKQFKKDFEDTISVRAGAYYVHVYLNWDKITEADIEEADCSEDDEKDYIFDGEEDPEPQQDDPTLPPRVGGMDWPDSWPVDENGP